MARGNAGAAGNGGSIRLRFDRQLRFASARIRIFGKLGRQNVSHFIGRALLFGFSFRFIGRAVCVAGVRSRGTE